MTPPAPEMSSARGARTASHRDYVARREMTLEERLAEERIVFLWGEITPPVAGGLIMRLLELDSQSPDREISLYINSPGKIMIHQPWGGVTGQASDIQIQAEEILKAKHLLNELLAKHTGRPVEQIAEETERDRYMTPLEAVQYGIVDEFVEIARTSGKKH